MGAKLPQQCPQCGADAQVKNAKPRSWQVVCSKNSVMPFGHRVAGHTMFTKWEAIEVWNDLRNVPEKG